MKSFALTISTPEGNAFDGEAVMISVRGTEGQLAVMAGHIPFVTSVKPCECKMETEDGEVRLGRTGGGILNVSHDKVTLLSGSFEWIKQ